MAGFFMNASNRESATIFWIPSAQTLSRCSFITASTVSFTAFIGCLPVYFPSQFTIA